MAKIINHTNLRLTIATKILDINSSNQMLKSTLKLHLDNLHIAFNNHQSRVPQLLPIQDVHNQLEENRQPSLII